MAISPGEPLGLYEVLSAIGAGGMGEVYQAHDTKLVAAQQVWHPQPGMETSCWSNGRAIILPRSDRLDHPPVTAPGVT